MEPALTAMMDELLIDEVLDPNDDAESDRSISLPIASPTMTLVLPLLRRFNGEREILR